MPRTILLFDLDGTLVNVDGAGRRAMSRAFGAVCGAPDAVTGVPFAGRTDRAIVRGGLRALGAPDDAAAVDRVIAAYLDALDAELHVKPVAPLPGVLALLDALRDRPDVALGLGTGNVRAGAERKLRRVDLWERFVFGGFGCDDEDRPALLRAGARRGAERLGARPEDCRVVVIGDTPLDVAAALAIGAACVGVATGPHPAAALRDAGAHAAFDDLTDPGVLDTLLHATMAPAAQAR